MANSAPGQATAIRIQLPVGRPDFEGTNVTSRHLLTPNFACKLKCADMSGIDPHQCPPARALLGKGDAAEGRPTLRMAIGSPQTERRHVAAAWAELQHAVDA